MSSLFVLVSNIENVRVHSNSDNLELCNVRGWQMVIPKGMYKNGDKVVYFPIDVCIPTKWSDKWNITKYLKAEGRVGKIQLRGEPSFGLAQRIPEGCEHWNIDDNVADYFECKKYEPPVRSSTGDAAAPHPLFNRYTDIENMRNFPELLSVGEEVIATEKSHGCLHKDTMVMLANGEMIKISELKSGMMVSCYDESKNEFTSSEILKVIQQIPTDKVSWVELEFENYGLINKIITTSCHLFLTKNRGWVKAGELTGEDEILDFLNS